LSKKQDEQKKPKDPYEAMEQILKGKQETKKA